MNQPIPWHDGQRSGGASIDVKLVFVVFIFTAQNSTRRNGSFAGAAAGGATVKMTAETLRNSPFGRHAHVLDVFRVHHRDEVVVLALPMIGICSPAAERTDVGVRSGEGVFQAGCEFLNHGSIYGEILRGDDENVILIRSFDEDKPVTLKKEAFDVLFLKRSHNIRKLNLFESSQDLILD